MAISASITGGKLRSPPPARDAQISFSQDSSGALAALGINYVLHRQRRQRHRGEHARCRSTVAAGRGKERATAATTRPPAPSPRWRANPLVVAERHEPEGSYQSDGQRHGESTAAAKNNAEATQTVTDTLKAQRASLSGVSLDEEAINLMQQQRAFQGAARLITVVDQMMNTLIQM